MWLLKLQWVYALSVIITFLVYAPFPVFGNLPEKADETWEAEAADPSLKCSACPCQLQNPCGQQLPRPPPPPPPPPPPGVEYCSPQTVAPPPPRFVYMTGPPGNLYPTDADANNWVFYSDADRAVAAGVLLALVGCGNVLLLQALAF